MLGSLVVKSPDWHCHAEGRGVQSPGWAPAGKQVVEVENNTEF